MYPQTNPALPTTARPATAVSLQPQSVGTLGPARSAVSSIFLPALALVVCLSTLLTGCGGGGSNSPSSPSTGGGTEIPRSAHFTVGIQWAARSRATSLTGPSSALSATITLQGAQTTTGSDVSFTVNRPDAQEAAYLTYTSPQEAKVGNHNLTVRFFSLPNGTGDIVGIAPSEANLQEDGNLIATIATVGSVRSVETLSGQAVRVGEAKEIAFTARNNDGATLALTPGSGFAHIVNGADVLATNGITATGRKPGVANISIEVDSFTSPSASVQVFSTAEVHVTPTPDASQLLSVGASQSFTATVNDPDNAQADQAVTWQVQEGAAGGSITSAGVYTAPDVPGTYHITATSIYDPTKTATITVQVAAGTVPVVVN